MSLLAIDVVVERRRKRLLDRVAVEVVPGRLTAIVGPNGAGKSTLVRVLAGELAPKSGRVTMNGTLLDTWSLKERARTRAVLSQAVHVSSPLKALEVVLLGRTPHNGGIETERDAAIARAALASVGCGELAERAYTTLSGGERQRIQLARTIAQLRDARDARNPSSRYLLLDEPTAALDLAHQHDCLALARSLLVENVGVLTVLHDLNLAARYADTIVVLSRGSVVAAGPPASVLTAERIRDVFSVHATVLAHPSPTSERDQGVPLIVADRPVAPGRLVQ